MRIYTIDDLNKKYNSIMEKLSKGASPIDKNKKSTIDFLNYLDRYSDRDLTNEEFKTISMMLDDIHKLVKKSKKSTVKKSRVMKASMTVEKEQKASGSEVVVERVEEIKGRLRQSPSESSARIETSVYQRLNTIVEERFTDKAIIKRVSEIGKGCLDYMSEINLGDEQNPMFTKNGNRDGYHNQEHLIDVLKSAMELADKLEIKLTQKELELLAVSAAGHDVGFGLRYDANEGAGAEMTANLMKEQGYSAKDIEIVKIAIVRATTTDFFKDKQGFQQHPVTKIEKILALADVYNFFRDKGDERNFLTLTDAYNRELATKDRREYVAISLAAEDFDIQLLKNYPIPDAGYSKLFLAQLERKRFKNEELLQQMENEIRESIA